MACDSAAASAGSTCWRPLLAASVDRQLAASSGQLPSWLLGAPLGLRRAGHSMQRYSLPTPGNACCASHTTSDNQRSCAR